MRLCSRIEGAFVRIETTLSTQEYVFSLAVEQRLTSCRCKQQIARDFPSTNPHTQVPEVSKSQRDTTRELMFELGNSYFDTTSRFSRFCRMWGLGYHGFEATTRLSTGKNGMQTYNTDRLDTAFHSMDPGIPPSYSSKRLRSWTSFRHFQPVPRKRAQVEALHHLPKNALTYARRHMLRMMPTHSMSSTRKGVSPMRSAATCKWSTSRCRSLSGRSVELISLVIKYFCAACLDPQCRSIICTPCKIRATMTDLTQFDASCLFRYTNGQVSTTGNEPRSASCLRIDLEGTIQYASTVKTTLGRHTLIKWTQANWMSFDVNWTSCTNLAEFDQPQVHTERVPC